MTPCADAARLTGDTSQLAPGKAGRRSSLHHTTVPTRPRTRRSPAHTDIALATWENEGGRVWEDRTLLAYLGDDLGDAVTTAYISPIGAIKAHPPVGQ
jgi:hypothetical protein